MVLSDLMVQNHLVEPYSVRSGQEETCMEKLQEVAYTGILFRGVEQIQLRTEDRQNGDLGTVAP